MVVSVLLWIATAASLAAGTYCETSTSIHFAHIWVSNSALGSEYSNNLCLTLAQITVIRAISVVMAVISILTFYKRTSSASKQHAALKQFVSVKILVFLNFIQTVCGRGQSFGFVNEFL